MIIETDSKENIIQSLADRISFSFYINKFLFSGPPSAEDINKHSPENSLTTEGSIAIKYKNRAENINSRPIVKTLAEMYVGDRKVTLENPDIEIRGLITDSTLYVCSKIAEINRSRFEERKVQNRPFFSPISLHPKLACALVNLSSIKKDGTLLDPFCGT